MAVKCQISQSLRQNTEGKCDFSTFYFQRRLPSSALRGDAIQSLAGRVKKLHSCEAAVESIAIANAFSSSMCYNQMSPKLGN